MWWILIAAKEGTRTPAYLMQTIDGGREWFLRLASLQGAPERVQAALAWMGVYGPTYSAMVHWNRFMGHDFDSYFARFRGISPFQGSAAMQAATDLGNRNPHGLRADRGFGGTESKLHGFVSRFQTEFETVVDEYSQLESVKQAWQWRSKHTMWKADRRGKYLKLQWYQ